MSIAFMYGCAYIWCELCRCAVSSVSSGSRGMTFKAFCLPCLLKLRLGQLEIASKVIARATRAAAAAVKGLQEQVAEANL